MELELGKVISRVRDKIVEIEDLAKDLEAKTDNTKTSKLLVDSATSLMNIQQRISRVIHSIQGLSILIQQSEAKAYESAKSKFLALPSPSSPVSEALESKSTLNQLIDQLKITMKKVVMLESQLLGPYDLKSLEDDHKLIQEISKDSDWGSEQAKSALRILQLAVEDNEDSVLILEAVIAWDFKSRFSVGRCKMEEENKVKDHVIEEYRSNDVMKTSVQEEQEILKLSDSLVKKILSDKF